jgi:fibronectin-binding autotransporter adhesin
MAQDDSAKLLSTREAASLIGYTHDYLSRLCREGKIRGTRVGTTWFIELGALRSFAQFHKVSLNERREMLSVERRSARKAFEASYETPETTSELEDLLPKLSKEPVPVAIPSPYVPPPVVMPMPKTRRPVPVLVPLLLFVLISGGAAAYTARTHIAAALTYETPLTASVFSDGIDSVFEGVYGAVAGVVRGASNALAAILTPQPIRVVEIRPSPVPFPVAVTSIFHEREGGNTYVTNVTNAPSYVYSGSGVSIEYVRQAIDNLRDDLSGRGDDDDDGGGGGLTDLTGSSIEELSDVASMTEAWGDLLFWNGSEWSNIATSSLGIAAGGGTPGGADTEVQFNNAGTFDGDAGFTYSAASSLLTATYASTTGFSSNYASSTSAFFGVIGINGETFTDFTGSGLQNVGGVLTLNPGGDWTGTFDGQEGSYYLSRANHTGTQAASTISDFDASVNAYIHASTTIPKTYTANTYTAHQTFSYASSTGVSSAYASSTNAFFGTLSVGNLSGLLKATGGLVNVATAGTDYLAGGAGAATTTLTISGPFTTSATPVVFGASPITSTYYGLATTSTLSSSQVLVSNGGAGVYGVSTSTATLGLGLSGSLTTLGSGQSLSIATSSLYTGATGQVAYFNGTNQIIGTSSLFIATSQNVGIGTANPTSGKLVVAGASTDTTTEHLDSGGHAYYQLDSGNNTFESLIRFMDGGTTRFTVGLDNDSSHTVFSIGDNALSNKWLNITNAGNVGIGTTSPYRILSVQGNVGFSGDLGLANLTATGTASTTNLAITGVASALLKTNALGQVMAASAGTDYIAGGAGAATTTVSCAGTASCTGFTVFGSSPITITGSGLASYDAWTHPGAGQSATTSLMLFSGNASTTQLSATSAYFGGTATSTFTSTGRLGIGTTSPAAALDIFNGSGNSYNEVLLRSMGNNTASVLSVQRTGTNREAQIVLGNLPSVDGAGFAVGIDGDSSNHFRIQDVTYANGSAPTVNTTPFTIEDNAANGAFIIKSNTGKVGVASTSPFANLSVHANNGSTNTTLFAIGSSTASATSTLFSVNNAGSIFTSLGTGLVKSTSGTLGLATAGTDYIASYDAWTHPAAGQSATTSLMLFNGNASSTQLSSGIAYFGQTGTTTITGTGFVGVGSSSPWARLSINPVVGDGSAPAFAIGSSTATNFVVTNAGNVGIGTAAPTAKLSIGTTGVNTLPTNTQLWVSGAGGTHATNLQGRISIGTDTNQDYGAFIGEINVDGSNPYAVIGQRHAGTDYPAIYVRGVSGNVGIGTTSPGSKLDVFGSNSAYAARFYNTTGNTGAGFFASSNNTALNFTNAAFSSFSGGTIDASTLAINASSGGSVGIGTTTPGARLHIDTSSNTSALNLDFQDGEYALRFQRSGASVLDIYKNVGLGVVFQSLPNAGTLGDFHFSSNAVEILTLKGNGNVGIGSTSPWQALSVNGSIALAGGNFYNTSAFQFLNGSSAQDVKVGSLWVSDNFSGTAPTNGAYIKGNVGIGTTTPAAKLDIYGTARVVNVATPTSGAGLELIYDPGTSLGAILSYDRTATAVRALHLGGNGTTGIRIDTAGNVGIGQTSPQTKLQINEAVSRTGFTGTGVGTALLVNTQGTSHYTTLDFSGGASVNGVAQSRIASVQTSNGSLLQFGTTNSYASGITNTAMTIDYSGNVGIGTTTPGTKLEVNGTIRTTNDTGLSSLVLGRTDNSLEGGQIDWVGAGSYDSWNTDVYTNNFRMFTSSANSNQVQIMNVGAGSAGLYVQGNVGIGDTSPASLLTVGNGDLFQVSSLGAVTGLSYAFNSGPSITTSGGQLAINASVYTYVPSGTFYVEGGSRLRGGIANDTAAYLTISGGTSGHTYFSGNVGIGTTTPWRGLSITSTSAQIAAAYDGTRYTQLSTDSIGDLTIDAQGGDIFAQDENLWVCAGGACPSGAGSLASMGNIIAETAIGVGSSTPWAGLSIVSGKAIVVGENNIATSTSMTVDWRNGNQQLVRTGTSGTTISFSGYVDGQKLTLIVCNPNATAGAISWGTQVLWGGGTAPTQTTSANRCDVWSFLATQATSTVKIFGSQSANF